jgi:hypothetical protein
VKKSSTGVEVRGRLADAANVAVAAMISGVGVKGISEGTDAVGLSAAAPAQADRMLASSRSKNTFLIICLLAD